ncbi:hypothetical protein LX36DRAFT_268960 [Colletotrichum falcatum]|nr:hypothetical protein LX36DRAFT_268960 [Colletotrichum falcatum]
MHVSNHDHRSVACRIFRLAAGRCTIIHTLSLLLLWCPTLRANALGDLVTLRVMDIFPRLVTCSQPPILLDPSRPASVYAPDERPGLWVVAWAGLNQRRFISPCKQALIPLTYITCSAPEEEEEKKKGGGSLLPVIPGLFRKKKKKHHKRQSHKNQNECRYRPLPRPIKRQQGKKRTKRKLSCGRKQKPSPSTSASVSSLRSVASSLSSSLPSLAYS